MITFNVPPYTGKELEYMKEAIDRRKICGDGEFTKDCNRWLEEKTGSPKALLTTSCTQALELAAILADVKPGDEVILPSFTSRSAASGASWMSTGVSMISRNLSMPVIPDWNCSANSTILRIVAIIVVTYRI